VIEWGVLRRFGVVNLSQLTRCSNIKQEVEHDQDINEHQRSFLHGSPYSVCRSVSASPCPTRKKLERPPGKTGMAPRLAPHIAFFDGV
jgi:hypothetical protein